MDEGTAGAEGVDAESSMEGFLYKRGALNKAFKKRFFRQQGTSLVYYTSPVCCVVFFVIFVLVVLVVVLHTTTRCTGHMHKV